MVKKLALLLIAVSLAWIGARALHGFFQSDEAKIRARLEAACAGFGDARMNPILEFLAPQFVDETSGFHRDDVRAAIASAFFSEKDPATRGFPYRASVVADSLVVDVAKPAGKSAEVRFSVRIVDTRGGGERLAWQFSVAGTMTIGEDGWQLSRATHDTVSGTWKLR
jgi:hypothetical protein